MNRFNAEAGRDDQSLFRSNQQRMGNIEAALDQIQSYSHSIASPI